MHFFQYSKQELIEFDKMKNELSMVLKSYKKCQKNRKNRKLDKVHKKNN